MNTARRKRPTRRLVKETRPAASRQETMAALLRGHFTGLIQEKRVPLATAEDTLIEVRKFLSPDAPEAIKDEDARIAPLVQHIRSERKRVPSAKDTLRDQRRVGQTVRYKVQRTNQRKAGFLHTPLPTLEAAGKTPLDEVDVMFMLDCILIKRTTGTVGILDELERLRTMAERVKSLAESHPSLRGELLGALAGE